MTKLLICSVAVMMALPGCAWFKKKPEPAKKEAWNKRLAGRVHKVDQASQFVLIRRYGKWYVAEGEVVESRGDGRTASLLPTGERLGEHVAADIRAGEVAEGDAVYIRRILKSAEPEYSPLTDKTSDRGGQ
jgi:hypothetical protein